MDLQVYALLKKKIEESTYDDTELRQKLLKVIEDVEIINGNGEGSISKAIADEIAKVIADAPDDFNTLKELSDWINIHSESAAEMNSRITQNTNNIVKKLDKNQGANNSGKIVSINNDGDIVPSLPVGVKYDENTKRLRLGTFTGNSIGYNIPVILDDSSDIIEYDFTISDLAIVTLSNGSKPVNVTGGNNGSIAIIICYGGTLDFSDTSTYRLSPTFGFIEPLGDEHIMYTMFYNAGKWDVTALVYAGGEADA